MTMMRCALLVSALLTIACSESRLPTEPGPVGEGGRGSGAGSGEGGSQSRGGEGGGGGGETGGSGGGSSSGGAGGARVGCDGPCEGQTSFLASETGGSEYTGFPCGSGFTNIQNSGGLRITNHANGFTSNRRCDQVLSAANNAGGAGGMGFRHWQGDGQNNQGGGIKFVFARPLTDVSFALTVRFASNLQWARGEPGYIKMLYGNFTNIFGYHDGAFGVNVSGGTNHPGSKTWQQLMGGRVSDGRWHCFEGRWNFTRRTMDMWINGEKILDKTNVDWKGAANLDSFYVSNQNEIAGAGSSDTYTDYDDLKYDTGLAAGATLGCS
jgi:hypothetical protein